MRFILRATTAIVVGIDAMAEEPFTPKGNPTPLEELTQYTDNGEVAITRAEVEKAIAQADDELKKFLEAGQKRKLK